jgi:hypothetical protein
MVVTSGKDFRPESDSRSHEVQFRKVVFPLSHLIDAAKSMNRIIESSIHYRIITEIECLFIFFVIFDSSTLKLLKSPPSYSFPVFGMKNHKSKVVLSIPFLFEREEFSGSIALDDPIIFTRCWMLSIFVN